MKFILVKITFPIKIAARPADGWLFASHHSCGRLWLCCHVYGVGRKKEKFDSVDLYSIAFFFFVK